jgi:hypothetical protein
VEAAVRDELAAVERELDAVRARVALDPLGASGDVAARLVPRVDAVSGRLGQLAAVRDRVADGVATARATLAEVHATRERAMQAVARLPDEIHGAVAPGVPTDAGLVEGLVPWLDKIEEAARAGRSQTAEVGLAKWGDAAREYLANDAPIAGALEKLLARRDELSGRLSARRAQAAALVARGVPVEASAEQAAREAEQLLRERPTHLARATELVDRYERLVRVRAV